MIRILYRIKVYYSKIWSVIERINSRLFGFFYSRTIHKKLLQIMEQANEKDLHFRFLTHTDQPTLLQLLHLLEPHLSGYFEPHDFSSEAIQILQKNQAFFMKGVFRVETLVGYFFIRAGINKKCFVGRLVHKEYRLKGIGRKMNHIMYHSVWEAGFRCFATISKNNHLIMNAHLNNKKMIVLKELDNDYLIVEFIKN